MEHFIIARERPLRSSSRQFRVIVVARTLLHLLNITDLRRHRIDRFHPQLDAFWSLWAQALHDAFQSGSYDRMREIAALNELLDCRMKNPVPFHKRYPLLILSATRHQLSDDLERKMLDYVMHTPSGIYYVYEKNISINPPILSRDFGGWLRAHQLLSRFRLWTTLATEAVNWIWAQRTDEGFWDVGSSIARKPWTSFPLSESWRRPKNRIIDSTVEILGLLSKVYLPRW